MPHDAVSKESAGWTRWVLILIGLGILALVAFSGGIKSDTLYILVVGFAFFFILLGILWHYKQQIGGTIIIILILFILIVIMGFVNDQAHLTAYAFRIGSVTILFTIAYAFWISPLALKSEIWKFIVFMVLICLFYASGFLTTANDWADKILGFIRG